MSEHASCLFQEVLRDEAGLRPRCSLKALKAFAATQLAEENIDFLAEVRTLVLLSRLFVFSGAATSLVVPPPQKVLKVIHSKQFCCRRLMGAQQ